MVAADVMVPCMSFSPACRLDWAAVAAVGGWLAAVVTFFAVLLPFLQGQKQRRELEDAAHFSATLSLEHFILTLIDVRRVVLGSIEEMRADPTVETAVKRATLLAVAASRVEYPDLPHLSALKGVRSDLAYLRRTLSVFADYRVAGIADAMNEASLGAFQASLRLCQEAASAVIRSSVPFVRQDLSRVFRDVFEPASE